MRYHVNVNMCMYNSSTQLEVIYPPTDYLAMTGDLLGYHSWWGPTGT